MRYTNPLLGAYTLLANLKDKGLAIEDEEKAIAFLCHVSYFRFAAYLRSFKMYDDTEGYKPTATFEKAVALYEFDAKLRMLLTDKPLLYV